MALGYEEASGTATAQIFPEAFEISYTVFKDSAINIAARELATIPRVAPYRGLDLKN